MYGRHLALGGARVYYFVRERYAAECRRGFTFYPLNRRHARREPVHVAVAEGEVLTRIDEVKAITWDQVYLCVASHALRGPWLGELAAAIGDATLVALQPGSEDREVITQVVPAERVVSGMITVISYHAPLEGETVPEPGMAYWFPPLAPAPFSGPEQRTRQVVEALRKGKLPSKRDSDVPAKVRFPSAWFMTMLTALEASGWSFRELAHGGQLARMHAAAIETFAIIGKAHDAKPPLGVRMLVRPFWVRRVMTLARWFMPLPVETYFRVHFTKVRDQTRMYMRDYIAQGDKLGLPTKALVELEQQVEADHSVSQAFASRTR